LLVEIGVPSEETELRQGGMNVPNVEVGYIHNMLAKFHALLSNFFEGIDHFESYQVWASSDGRLNLFG
jgi:hypothetical protein